MSETEPTPAELARARLDRAVLTLVEAESHYAAVLANFNKAGNIRRRIGGDLNRANAAVSRSHAAIAEIAKELALLK